MLIDWFTVGAQALNFVILLWLMKRFLYQPIVHAIDAREQRIAAQLADAAATKAEAERQRDDFQHKNAAFDQQRAALLRAATEEATDERQRLLDEARQAAEALGARRREALHNEARHLDKAIGGRIREEVFAIARKALADLAGTSLEERLCEVFVRRLQEMDEQTRAGLADALRTSTDPALVRSAFELPAEQRATLQATLERIFPAGVRVRFETVPELVGGIELSASGRKLAWSIADYLGSLEKSVGELVDLQAAPVRKAP